MQQGNKKLIIQLIIFVVAFAIAFFGTKYVMAKFTSTKSIVEKTSEKLNKKCPLLLAPNIRLDHTDANSVKGQPGLVFVCTLTNEEVKAENFNPSLVEQNTKAVAQKDYDTNPVLEKAKERDVTIYYVCKDKNGVSLLGFEIPGQNNNPKK